MNANVCNLRNSEKGYFEILPIQSGDDANNERGSNGYYEIRLINRHIKASSKDGGAEFEKGVLVFSGKSVLDPVRYTDKAHSGYFCLFNDYFFRHYRHIGDFPVFNLKESQFISLNENQLEKVNKIYVEILNEVDSDFIYKYDVIRNLILELIYFAIKIAPKVYRQSEASQASRKITDLFIQLLESQFPIESPEQQLKYRFPIDFSERLSIHVNHLNRVLKEITGKTTSQYISERIMVEAQCLLKYTDWNISDIATCLGFDEPPHFINFFKKGLNITPRRFRMNEA